MRSIFLFILFSYGAFAQSNYFKVSIQPNGQPANDLIYNGNVINSEQAFELQNQGVDLSELEPTHNSLWDPQDKQSPKEDEKLSLTSGETVQFLNFALMPDGAMKLVVLRSNNEVTNLYLDSKMLTTHLRKNMLRELGYKVPKLKRLAKIKIDFPSQEIKDQFKFNLKAEVDLLYSAQKWIVSEQDLSLELRDVSEIESGFIIYNFARGIFTSKEKGHIANQLRNRAERAVLLAYSLCDMPESINQMNWHVGRIKDKHLILPLFSPTADFSSTTIDDLRWLGLRLKQLTRQDFSQIVNDSHFPSPVSDILVEKLIARRNSLLSGLSIPLDNVDQPQPKLTIKPHLIDGKIIKKDWTDQGHATYFSGEDAANPFEKGFHNYILSIFQSIGIDTLIGRVNKELQAFDPTKARLKLAEKQFYEGLDHYVETGEFLQFPISAWFFPILGGRVILSRDIIIGNYLGTDNLVQMADTFGVAAQTGLQIGFENIKGVVGASNRTTASYVKTFTHIKPLKSLKTVFKEKYRNMIVPFLKWDLRSQFKSLKDDQKKFNSFSDEQLDEKEKFLSDMLVVINETLGVGESLLITERFTQDNILSGAIPLATPLMGQPIVFKLGLGAGHAGVKRLQILRKSPSVIQIFDDQGDGIYTSFNFDLNYIIPILRLSKKLHKGKYNIKFKKLDITANLENKNFFQNLEALNLILRKSNFKLIENDDRYKDGIGQLNAKFTDSLTKNAFLPWRRKRLKAYTEYDFQPDPKQIAGNYVSYRDHIQTGMNWESFVKDIVGYYLNQISQDVDWANNIWQNPSNSIAGSSKTKEYDYEAFVTEGGLSRDFAKITERREGWSKSEKKALRFAKKINKKFGFELFNSNLLLELKKLHLYEIFSQVNVYDKGLQKLKRMKLNKFITLVNYIDRETVEKCEKNLSITFGNGDEIFTCGYYKNIFKSYHSCYQKEGKLKPQMSCWLGVVKQLYRRYDIKDFAHFFGIDNIYVYAEIRGFRKKSETHEPIRSSGLGRQDPRNEDGIISLLKHSYDIPTGEFEGYWLRDRIQ